MDKEAIELIISKLDIIGEKIGTGVETIWPWFIRQQYVEALMGIVTLMVSSFIFYRLIKFVKKHWSCDPDSKYEGYSIRLNDHETIWITILINYGIVYTVFTFGSISSIMDILNVEYHAFNSLLSHLK